MSNSLSRKEETATEGDTARGSGHVGPAGTLVIHLGCAAVELAIRVASRGPQWALEVPHLLPSLAHSVRGSKCHLHLQLVQLVGGSYAELEPPESQQPD